ncbi:MAG: carboxypeptidase-like regulatory domain-containing protein, partial [Myxococcota bacterium]
ADSPPLLTLDRWAAFPVQKLATFRSGPHTYGMRWTLFIFLASVIACASTPKPSPEASAPVDGPEVAEASEPEPPVERTPSPRRRAPARESASPPRAPVAQAAPAVANTNRCVTGAVRAQGDIVVPVKNATVSFLRDSTLLGKTRTDSNGKFAWCAGPNLTGRIRMTVKVSKPPFQTVSQQRDWTVGVQEEFDFALVAPEI